MPERCSRGIKRTIFQGGRSRPQGLTCSHRFLVGLEITIHKCCLKSTVSESGFQRGCLVRALLQLPAGAVCIILKFRFDLMAGADFIMLKFFWTHLHDPVLNYLIRFMYVLNRFTAHDPTNASSTPTRVTLRKRSGLEFMMETGYACIHPLVN